MEKAKGLVIRLTVFFLFSILYSPLLVGTANSSAIESPITLIPQKDWLIAGSQLHIEVAGETNANYVMSVFFPNGTLYGNIPFTTDSNGEFLFTRMTSANAPVGTYVFRCERCTTWVTIINGKNFVEVPSPVAKEWNGLTYTIKPLELNVTDGLDEFSFDFPFFKGLTPTVTIYQNTHVTKVSAVGTTWTADINYIFMHSGVKIIINGTVPTDVSFTWRLSSVKAFLKRMCSVKSGSIVFDWDDMRTSGITTNWDVATSSITFTIKAGDFWIDPYIFMDGFESGDFSGWDGTSGSPTIVTSPTHHGTYAMQSNFTANWQNIFAYDDSAELETTVFVRWYARFSALPGSGERFKLIQTKDISLNGFLHLGINETGGSYYLWLDYYGTTNSTYGYAYAFQANTWYGFKIKYVQDGSNGEVRAWLDGSEVITDTGMNTTSHTFRRVQLGFSSDTVGSFIVWSDCMVIDNADIAFESTPTIGQFQAPTTVYANQYFFLNATIQSITDRTNQSFVNATIEISNNVILQWLNSTNVFSVNSDPSSYVTLDVATSTKTSVNSTSHKLSWYIKLNSYPAGSIDVIVTNTKVFDDGDFSGSGSETGLFTFSYITLTLQARDADGTNLPKTVSYSGTYGNATTLSSTNSDSSGLLALTTCYGDHTITTKWGTHTVDSSRSISVTADATENIDTKIQRLDSGSNYLLFSLDNTDLVTPELVGTYDWRMESVTGTGSIEFKMDNANWIKTGVPYSFTTGSQTWTSGTGTWAFSSNTFTFTVEFSTQTLSMAWDQPSGDDGGGGGGGGGGGTTPEEPVIIPIPDIEPVVPTIPTEFLPTPPTEPALLSSGVILIIVSIVAVIGYGEFRKRNPSARKAFKNRAKHKKIKFPSPKKTTIKWSKPAKKKVDWKKK